MARKAHPPIHPGEILLQEFLEPMELSQYRLAKDISVPPRRINEIVHGKRAISADTALRWHHTQPAATPVLTATAPAGRSDVTDVTVGRLSRIRRIGIPPGVSVGRSPCG